MTLSIGIADRAGRVWIGADTSLVAGAMIGRAREPKVWTQGPWTISGSGDWRPLSVVRFSAKLPNRPSKAEADKVVAMDLTMAMRVALESNGYTYDASEGDQTGPNSWLIGLQGVGLWELDTKWHAVRQYSTAIGSCYEYALGWLACDMCKRYEPEQQIRDCIKAAAKTFRGGVRTPALVIGP